MVEQWVFDFLSDQAGITDIVGDAIHVDTLPQRASFPCLRFETVSETRPRILGGRNMAGIVKARIQFDCMAMTPSQANEIIDALFNALQGKRGTYNGRELMNCWIEEGGPHGSEDDPIDGSDSWLYVRTVDYFFKLRESVPDA